MSQRYFQGSEQTLISNQLLAQTMQSACLGHVPFDTSAGRVAQPTPSVRHCARTHPPHVRAHPLAGGHLFALRDAWAAYRTSCAGDVLTTAFPLVRSPRAAIYNDTVADRGEQSGDLPRGPPPTRALRAVCQAPPGDLVQVDAAAIGGAVGPPP